MIPLYEVLRVGKNHWDRKQNGGYQQLGGGENEELLFNRYRVSFLQDQRSYGDGWVVGWATL